MPGLLKNAIDWVSRSQPQPFNERHGLLLSASPSMAGGNRGLWALRVPFEHLGARIYPDMFSLAQAHQAFDDGGHIADPQLQAASTPPSPASWTSSKQPSTTPARSALGRVPWRTPRPRTRPRRVTRVPCSSCVLSSGDRVVQECTLHLSACSAANGCWAVKPLSPRCCPTSAFVSGGRLLRHG